MATALTIQDLTPAFRRLVELMQNINFGWIERLEVRGGQPVLSPMPRIVRDRKFGSRHGPTQHASHQNFALKESVRECIDAIGTIGDGIVERLEIQNGLPFRLLAPDSMAG